MSLTVYPAIPVEPHQRDALYDHAASFDTELSRNSRAIRLGGYIVGAAGTLIGVAAALALVLILPLKQTTVQFIPVNVETGLVGTAVLARDAPAVLFRDQQARADLLKFVSAAETWVADTADLNFHIVAVMSGRDAQAAFAERMSPRNPISPRVLYGAKATVRVEHFRFTPLGRVPGGAQLWQVRFDRTEVIGGALGLAKPWLATVSFAWHPDIVGSDADRAINLTGFQATSYGAGPA